MSSQEAKRCGGSGRIIERLPKLPGAREAFPVDKPCPGCDDPACPNKEAKRCPTCTSPDPDIAYWPDAPWPQAERPCPDAFHTAPMPTEGEMERCRSCGESYPQVWAAENDLWNAVIGSPNGTRCMPCFDREAHAAGFSPYWACVDGHFSFAQLETASSELERCRQERDEAVEAALRKDFHDVLALVDVNCRHVAKQAAKIRTEADRVRKWANTENARVTGLHTLADRLDTCSNNIARFIDRPALTQHRQEQAAKEKRRHQQHALEARADAAEAHATRLEAAIREAELDAVRLASRLSALRNMVPSEYQQAADLQAKLNRALAASGEEERAARS